MLAWVGTPSSRSAPPRRGEAADHVVVEDVAEGVVLQVADVDHPDGVGVVVERVEQVPAGHGQDLAEARGPVGVAGGDDGLDVQVVQVGGAVGQGRVVAHVDDEDVGALLAHDVEEAALGVERGARHADGGLVGALDAGV